MKLAINREDLLSPLQQIVSVIEKRQTMPILSNVMMVVEDNQMILTGSDLEIQLVAKINVAMVSPGSITVPARKFLDICRLLPSGAEIKLELQDEKIKIASGRSRFSLSSLPAENYPEFAESGLDSRLSIKAGKFKKGLEKTVFCMANQDVRYYLNGLLFSVSNSKLKMVASDGHRLSVYEDTLDHAVDFERNIILPRKGVIELSRLLNDPEAELKIEISNSNVRIFIKNIIFSAKLVDSRYPDFSKIFQQAFFSPIHIPRQILKEALVRVAILSNEKFKGISLDITPGNIKISTHNPEHEEAEEELAIEYAGDPISIGFNGQYLLDAVSNLDSDDSTLTIASNLSACFIEAPGGREYRFIVMPMRL